MENEDKKSPERRTTDLLVEFEDGYSANTVFVFPAAFRSALDISKTRRVKTTTDPVTGEKKTQVTWPWTQGRRYAFERGDVAYSDRSAYESWPPPDGTLMVKVEDATTGGWEDRSAGKWSDGTAYFKIQEIKQGKPVKTWEISGSQADLVELLVRGTIDGQRVVVIDAPYGKNAVEA